MKMTFNWSPIVQKMPIIIWIRPKLTNNGVYLNKKKKTEKELKAWHYAMLHNHCI